MHRAPNPCRLLYSTERLEATMVGNAQRQADAKYRKEHVKSVTIKFYSAERSIYDRLMRQGNREGYVKEFLKRNMT